jgi:hypothetical protein
MYRNKQINSGEYMARRLVYIFTIASLLTMLFVLGGHSGVLVARADCSGNVVIGDGGADCSTGGGTGDNGGSSGNNNNGNEGSNNNGTSSGSSNSSGGTGIEGCTAGTDIVPGSVTIPLNSSNVDGSINVTLPNGSVVSGDSIPSGLCMVAPGMVDACTGAVVDSQAGEILSSGFVSAVNCTGSGNITPPNPCDQFIVTGGGVTCVSDLTTSSQGSKFSVTAHANWPGTEIHTRPYPATLVDWDTVMRVAGLGSTSGAGHLGYANWGGGSPSSPAGGDWRDVTLRLDIKPAASWADVHLENIGTIRMPIGVLHTFQWHLPSHPAAGGGPTAGAVGQLEELPGDTPLYSNWTRAPYMVYCTLEYYEWESACEAGPDAGGSTNCRKDANGNYTGHKEWGWKHHGQTIAITPDMAKSVAPGLLADLNGDGKPDAYWGRTTFVRRMDDAGNVNNPDWAHSYSWPGPYWYWAVREGQGQVGWPGVPVNP